MICTSIMHTLMLPSQCFLLQISKLMNCYRRFCSKGVLKDIFNSEILYRYNNIHNGNWTLCHTIQGVIMLVILNRTYASHLQILKLLDMCNTP